jgi:hypothetical protein
MYIHCTHYTLLRIHRTSKGVIILVGEDNIALFILSLHQPETCNPYNICQDHVRC